MSAYVRRNLGGGLFLIEWTLSVVGGVADNGDFFENDGAEPISVFASCDVGLGLAVGLKMTNVTSDDFVINVSGKVLLPIQPGFEPAYTPVPFLPPIMWKYAAQAGAGSSSNGTARVGIVFREL